MKIIQNINYVGDNSEWHLGDLYIPESDGPFPIALCIHGGGWSSMDRHSFAGVAEFMCSQGFAAFNIEYRLLGTAPWPACGDDCLTAANFLLNGGIENHHLKTDKVFVIGASAGGHLSLMTGMRLPREKVSGIVSIAGVTCMKLLRTSAGFRIDPLKFWGYEPTDKDIEAASPVDIVTSEMAPILCTHCPGDVVVGIEHGTTFIEHCRKIGADAELFEYDRPVSGHCIWIPDSNPHKLYPEIESAIATLIKKVY